MKSDKGIDTKAKILQMDTFIYFIVVLHSDIINKDEHLYFVVFACYNQLLFSHTAPIQHIKIGQQIAEI